MLKPRKRLVKAKLKEDKLLTFTDKAQRFLQAKWRIIAYVIAAIVIVLAISGFMAVSKRSARTEASYKEMLARDAFSQRNTDEALQLANEVIDDYSGTQPAAAALFLKAKIYQQRGDLERSKEAYLEVAKKSSTDKYTAFAAYLALGAIEYGEKNYDEAADYYEKAAKKYPDHFHSPKALISAGESLERLSKYEEAKRIYHTVLKKYPKSRSANTARTNLAELEFMG